jgi:hypothetical protein
MTKSMAKQCDVARTTLDKGVIIVRHNLPANEYVMKTPKWGKIRNLMKLKIYHSPQ